MIALRKPRLADIPAMMTCMAPHIRAERLLPRTPRVVVEQLREYLLAWHGDVLVGVGSLRLVDVDLAEVGALCGTSAEVERLLLDALVEEARGLGVGRAFVLTHDPALFEEFGFRWSSLDALPEKRDRQCVHCPRVAHCRQVALELLLHDASACAAAK